MFIIITCSEEHRPTENWSSRNGMIVRIKKDLEEPESENIND